MDNSVEEMSRRLVKLSGRVDRDMKRFGGYYISTASEFAPLARHVERSVFFRQFGNDDATMDREYDPYEENSLFVLVVDHEAHLPVGVLRRIVPGAPGLKTLRDLEETPGWGASAADIDRWNPGGFDHTRCHDIATLATNTSWSSSIFGSPVTAALLHLSWRLDLTMGTDHIIAALDERAARLLRIAGVPIRPICDLPALPYLGSAGTRPYIYSVEEALQAAATAGPVLRALAFGDGLRKHFSLPPIDLRDYDGSRDPTTLEPQGRLVGTGVDAVRLRRWSPTRVPTGSRP